MNHTDDVRGALSPKQTLLFILLPMVATVVGARLKLHLVGIQHLYVGGYIVTSSNTSALPIPRTAAASLASQRWRGTKANTNAAGMTSSTPEKR